MSTTEFLPSPEDQPSVWLLDPSFCHKPGPSWSRQTHWKMGFRFRQQILRIREEIGASQCESLHHPPELSTEGKERCPHFVIVGSADLLVVGLAVIFTVIRGKDDSFSLVRVCPRQSGYEQRQCDPEFVDQFPWQEQPVLMNVTPAVRPIDGCVFTRLRFRSPSGNS
jgi:hypothetical protein